MSPEAKRYMRLLVVALLENKMQESLPLLDLYYAELSTDEAELLVEVTKDAKTLLALLDEE